MMVRYHAIYWVAKPMCVMFFVVLSQDYVMNIVKYVSIEKMQGKGVDIYILDA